jgi:hypothetical protein
MPETIKVAGKKLPKNAVYIGGALVAGIVGYAWWTKGVGGAEAEAPAEELPEPVPEPTDEPGFGVVGGGPPPGRNSDWTELAVQRLSNQGVSATALYAALGKFLQRKPLNKTELSLVQQAIAAAGMPPEFGPWTLIEEVPGAVVPKPIPPPVGTKPPATGRPPANPRNLGVLPLGPGRVGISWPAVAGATKYRYRWELATRTSGWTETTRTSLNVTWKFKKGTQFTARVQAGNRYGWSSQGVRGNITRAR